MFSKLSNAQKIRNFVRITRTPFTSADVARELDIPRQTILNNLNMLKAEGKIKVISRKSNINIYIKNAPKDYALLNNIVALAKDKMIWKYQVIERLNISPYYARQYLHQLVNMKVLEYVKKQKGYRLIGSLPGVANETDQPQ